MEKIIFGIVMCTLINAGYSDSIYDYNLFNLKHPNNIYGDGNDYSSNFDEGHSYGYGPGQIGQQCDTHHKPCDTSRHLECIDGKCACANPRNHHFDPEIGECVSLSRASCGVKGQLISTFLKSPPKPKLLNASPPLQRCTKNSGCFHGFCKCNWGFSSTAAKTCKLNHGQHCRPHQCNQDRGLACKDSVCRCADSTAIYKFLSGRCADPQEEIARGAALFGRAVVFGSIMQAGSGFAAGITGRVFRTLGLIAAGLG